MHRIALLALLALAACAAPPPVTGFRDPAAPIYSSAVLDAAGLAGDWRQVGDFAATPGCEAALQFVPGGAGLRAEGALCLAGQLQPVSGLLVPVGPGRFALAGLPDPLWVLWADGDLRTLVLGTPSGRFGMILNRGGALPPDRLTAARDVLEWNGYDVERLQIIR